MGGRTKIGDRDVAIVLIQHAFGVMQFRIAQQFGVWPTAIQKIVAKHKEG